MVLWKRAALLGFLTWFIPFLISFALFPVKKSNAPLFSTLMSLLLLFTTAALLKVYFRHRTVSTIEAALVGMIWLMMNLAFDYPMFSRGPMQMAASAYYSEIGLAYLAIPIFAFGAARLVRQ